MHKHHRERLRKKFIEHGIDALADHEIIELFLFYAIPRKNTNEISHKLMNKFGNFSSMCDAPFKSLLKIDGVGECTAVLLKLMPHMCRIYLENKYDDKDKIMDINTIGTFLKNKYIGSTNEHVYLMLLDSKLRLLYCDNIGDGILSEVNVCTKKIIELALFYNASIAVLSHNHPSGIALPSRNDLNVTSQLINALKIVDVKLIDHIIVADDDYVSLAETGLWESLSKEGNQQ